MKSENASMSWRTPWKFLASSPSTMRDVAGRHRVDHHHVGDVEDRVFVVHEFIGRRGLKAVVAHLHALRTEQTHVDEDRRGAGAAVVGEGDGTRAGGNAVLRVRDEEDVRARLAGGALQRQGSRGRGVRHGLAAELPGVLGLLVVVDGGRCRPRVRAARGSLGHRSGGGTLTRQGGAAGLGPSCGGQADEAEGRREAANHACSGNPQEVDARS